MAMKKLTRTAAVEETRFRFEKKGDALEGYYVGSETFNHNGDELTKHRFKNDDGEIVSTLGSYVLNQDLKSVESGVRVRITFDGKVKTKKGRTANAYTIEVDADDRVSA
jgi:hypothetical protein